MALLRACPEQLENAAPAGRAQGSGSKLLARAELGYACCSIELGLLVSASMPNPVTPAASQSAYQPVCSRFESDLASFPSTNKHSSARVSDSVVRYIEKSLILPRKTAILSLPSSSLPYERRASRAQHSALLRRLGAQALFKPNNELTAAGMGCCLGPPRVLESRFGRSFRHSRRRRDLNQVLRAVTPFEIKSSGNVSVSGRSKPASHGRLKTGHFEEWNIRHLDFPAHPAGEVWHGESTHDGPHQIDLHPA